MLVGYARVSTADQVAGLEGQHRDLSATGCTKTFSERVSSVAQRDELAKALDFVRDGDTLTVTRLDRLARSTSDLLAIIATLERKGVALRILDFGGQAVDTQSPSGKLIVTMFGAVAQFERELLLVRQREGIQKAKAEGRYLGRVPHGPPKSPSGARTPRQRGQAFSHRKAPPGEPLVSLSHSCGRSSVSAAVPLIFAEVSAKLVDLHAIALEGQCADNSPDVQSVLGRQLKNGLRSLNADLREVARMLEAN